MKKSSWIFLAFTLALTAGLVVAKARSSRTPSQAQAAQTHASYGQVETVAQEAPSSSGLLSYFTPDPVEDDRDDSGSSDGWVVKVVRGQQVEEVHYGPQPPRD